MASRVDQSGIKLATQDVCKHRPNVALGLAPYTACFAVSTHTTTIIANTVNYDYSRGQIFTWPAGITSEAAMATVRVVSQSVCLCVATRT